jgi:hypothetical protein
LPSSVLAKPHCGLRHKRSIVRRDAGVHVGAHALDLGRSQQAADVTGAKRRRI